MPSIPDDMSAAAVAARAKLTEKMRAAKALEVIANPPAPPKPRIAKGR